MLHDRDKEEEEERAGSASHGGVDGEVGSAGVSDGLSMSEAVRVQSKRLDQAPASTDGRSADEETADQMERSGLHSMVQPHLSAVPGGDRAYRLVPTHGSTVVPGDAAPSSTVPPPIPLGGLPANPRDALLVGASGLCQAVFYNINTLVEICEEAKQNGNAALAVAAASVLTRATQGALSLVMPKQVQIDQRVRREDIVEWTEVPSNLRQQLVSVFEQLEGGTDAVQQDSRR